MHILIQIAWCYGFHYSWEPSSCARRILRTTKRPSSFQWAIPLPHSQLPRLSKVASAISSPWEATSTRMSWSAFRRGSRTSPSISCSAYPLKWRRPTRISWYRPFPSGHSWCFSTRDPRERPATSWKKACGSMSRTKSFGAPTRFGAHFWSEFIGLHIYGSRWPPSLF